MFSFPLGVVLALGRLIRTGAAHLLVQTYLIVTLIYVVNFALAVWLERRAGTRVRRNVAGSGGAGTPTRGRLGRTAAAPSTLA